MRAKDNKTNGQNKELLIPQSMDRLMNGADQREGINRAKNHLMNIYGGRFWFSLNVSGYTTFCRRQNVPLGRAPRGTK